MFSRYFLFGEQEHTRQQKAVVRVQELKDEDRPKVSGNLQPPSATLPLPESIMAVENHHLEYGLVFGIWSYYVILNLIFKNSARIPQFFQTSALRVGGCIWDSKWPKMHSTDWCFFRGDSRMADKTFHLGSQMVQHVVCRCF